MPSSETGARHQVPDEDAGPQNEGTSRPDERQPSPPGGGENACAAREPAHCRIEKMYRLATEQASDIIILYDADRRILYASEALQRVLKRGPAELDGRRYRRLVHPDDCAEVAMLEQIPQPGQTLTATYRIRHGDGHCVWIETTCRAIYDGSGNLQNIVAVSRDVSERQRRQFETAAARDRAEAANIAKSTFLANMSHELRTPLNAIIGFADLMRRQMFGPLGSERYAEYAQLIHESGELLLNLVSDVLDMAKIEAGKLELRVETVDLRELVAHAARLLEERARIAEITLKTELAEGDLRLDGDRRALQQILLNLLSNAVKFTPAGGAVTVRVERRPQALALMVADDGIGIPAEDLPRLGQPFEQVTTDPTLSQGGTGLGLALVRALAGKHGGSMRVDSEEGLGTTVTVELPLAAGTDCAAA